MNEIVKFIDETLPIGNINSGIRYNENQNVFLTPGYTSIAGNTYFNGIRLSDRIIIKTDRGIGYKHQFLNGITIYSFKNKEIKMIASRSYSDVAYSENRVKDIAKEIVIEELKKEAQKNELVYEDQWLNEFVLLLVDDAYKNQLDTLKRIKLNNLLLP